MKSARVLEIEDELLAVAEDEVVPYGYQSRLAEKYMVSHQRIQQIQKALGLRSEVLLADPSLCECGKKKSYRATQCWDCVKEKYAESWVKYACGWCGTLIRRRRADVEWRKGRSNQTPSGVTLYTGRQFCDRQCMGQWFGHKHGRGAQIRKRQAANA